VATRDSTRFANFLDFQQKKLVYKRYASLFFAMVIDPEDNMLSALVSMHFLVETLDRTRTLSRLLPYVSLSLSDESHLLKVISTMFVSST